MGPRPPFVVRALRLLKHPGELRARISWSLREQFTCRLPTLYPRLASPFEPKTYMVEPKSIQFRAAGGEFPVRTHTGRVLGGDWDLPGTPFEKFDFYQAFGDVLQGAAWDSTPFYGRVLGEILGGKIKWGCVSETDFRQRLSDLERIYEQMARTGYSPPHSSDEITVNIGRYGDLLFNDGRHRLTFAKYLQVPLVPVQITVRHALWAEFKKNVLLYASRHGGHVYTPLLHPDLASIVSEHGHDRFDIITSTLGAGRGRLLDIGCHWGYFCHRFEELGFECVGIEMSDDDFWYLDRLRRAGRCRFRTVHADITEYLASESMHYDVVLALNIFHHFAKTEQGLERLIGVLGRLDTDVMFFEAHRTNEPQMQNAYRNFATHEFVDFILQHSCLERAEAIGTAEDGRSLFKLSR